MNPKTVLVTGGTGFVGANLVRQLLADGHTIHLFVREGYKDWRIQDLLPHLHIHILHLFDAETLRAQVAAIRPAWVFHLAAYGAYSWQADLHQAIQTNFLSTVNIVEACRAVGFESFLYTGSSSEYGAKTEAASEADALEPDSYYAVAKASATLFCRYTAQRFGLPLFPLRLYSVFGPYEEPGRLIPTLILRGLQGHLPPLANPSTARDFIFTEDVIRACLHVAASAATLPAGEIYNVGSGQQTTLAEVAELTQEIFELTDEPHWSAYPNHLWDKTTWQANNEKLRATGWQPENNFRSGFLKTIDWFRENLMFLETIYKNNE